MVLIYILTNIITGLSYIGKTGKTLDERWAQHVADARNGSTNYLHRAIEKYGADSFTREVICECSEEDANTYERFCIVAFNTRSPHGYNMTDGGDGVPGYVFTEEDRKKLGSGHRGKKRPPRSEEWKQKLGESVKKHWATPEGQEAFRRGVLKRSANPVWKEKLIADGARRASDPEWHKKISDGIKKAYANPEIKARMLAAMAKRENGWAEKMAIRSANPKWIAKQKEGAKRRSQTPEWKANHAAMCASPEYRAKLSKAQKLRRDRMRFEKYLINAQALYA